MSRARSKWYGKDVKAFTAKEIMKQVLRCAADLQGKSQREAPVDTGDLRGNCNVSPEKSDGNTKYHDIGYDLPYAVIQHETSWFNHPMGGGPKFLENPFNQNKKQYEQYIEKATKEALKRE